MKTCNMCKKRKPLSDYAKDCTRPDGHLYRCRPCHRLMVIGDRENFKTGPKPTTIEEKFLDKVIVTDGCWAWSGAKTRYGYGKISHNGRFPAAHRVSWQIHKGEIDEGLSVLHRCDNPECTNPDHLFLGTQANNMRDMLSKNRGRWRNK